jgi:hypothetical protein
MTTEQEIWDFLHRHLQSIFERDVETYKATTSSDLSLYEWFVSPHRLDGPPAGWSGLSSFHD